MAYERTNVYVLYMYMRTGYILYNIIFYYMMYENERKIVGAKSWIGSAITIQTCHSCTITDDIINDCETMYIVQ